MKPRLNFCSRNSQIRTPFAETIIRAHFHGPMVSGVLLLIKDTLNKGHLCIKDNSDEPTYINKFLPQKEDNFSIMDKMNHPNVSVIQRFHSIAPHALCRLVAVVPPELGQSKTSLQQQ